MYYACNASDLYVLRIHVAVVLKLFAVTCVLYSGTLNRRSNKHFTETHGAFLCHGVVTYQLTAYICCNTRMSPNLHAERHTCSTYSTLAREKELSTMGLNICLKNSHTQLR